MRRGRKYEQELTPTEKYNLDYERGFRQGYLESSRKILKNILRIRGKEQNYKVSKDLLRKINYETDGGYLNKLIFTAIDDDVTIKEIEEKYDEIFRTEEDIISEEHTIYSKSNDD